MALAVPNRFSNNSTAGLVTIGLVTDLHFDPTTAAYLNRYPTEGQEKLAAAILQWNTVDLDFIVNCGDFIDGSSSPAGALSSLQTIWTQLQTANCQTFYHVHGNHDLYQLTKAQLISALGMPASYYSVDVKGVHFVFLDAENYRDDDVSPYPLPPTGFNETSTYINPAQRIWLAADLAVTKLPSLIFLHPPLFVQPAQPTLVLANPSEVLPIIEAANVIAVINGHAHVNGFNVTQTIGGIPCITMQAMSQIDYSGTPATAYAGAIIAVNPNNKSVTVKGFAGQTSYSLGAR